MCIMLWVELCVYVCVCFFLLSNGERKTLLQRGCVPQRSAQIYVFSFTMHTPRRRLLTRTGRFISVLQDVARVT